MIVKKRIEINLDEMMSDTDFGNNWDFIDGKVYEEYGEEILEEKITSGYELESFNQSSHQMVWTFEVDE